MEKMRLPKKPDSVINALRDAILSGQIECGTELTQMELAESLGVSRMPIREALIVLEYQGLVERLSNQHVRVAEINRAFFENVFSLAGDIERRILKDHLPDISEAAEELAFHRALYRQAGNPFLRRILETVAESYIHYGMHCSGYDRSAALSLLRRACAGDEADNALTEYYRRLTDIIMEVRNQ